MALSTKKQRTGMPARYARACVFECVCMRKCGVKMYLCAHVIVWEFACGEHSFVKGRAYSR